MIYADLNYTQQRLKRSVMVVEGDASRWDTNLSVNALITDDGMAMRRPVQLTDAWYTTTGTTNLLYQRFGLAALENEAGTSLAIAGGYVASDLRLVGDTFVENLGGTPARVYTQGEWSVNQGFYLECWVPPSKGSEKSAIDFAWGEYGAVGCVGVRCFVGGEIEVYKWLDVGGTATRTLLARYDAKGGKRSASKVSSAGQLLSVLLVPCSRRDLYIATSTGTTVRHTFAELSPDSVGTITPAGRAWFYVPEGKMSVSLSELRFGTGVANLWTEIDYLREAPSGVVAWSSTIYWDKPINADPFTTVTATVMQADAPTSAYPPTGGEDRARILLQLTGGYRSTPFVYAAYSRLAPTVQTLPNNALLLSGNSTSDVIDTTDDAFQGFDLMVADQPDGVSGSLSLRDSGDEAIFMQSGHSVRLLASYDKVPGAFSNWRALVRGVTGTPKKTEAQRQSPGIRHVSMPFRDEWALLDAAIFEEDSYPYDGWLLHQAVGDLLTLAGIPTADRDIQTTTLRIDYVRPTTDTPWGWKPQAGDSVGQWIKKLWEAFAPSWFVGFFPKQAVGTVQKFGFQFRSPLTMTSDPSAYVWLAADGVDIANYPETGTRTPAFSFSEERLAAEASRISIYGFDPASKTVLRATWSDATLEDATTTPAARPPGWIGMPAPYVAILPRLRSASSVVAAKDATVTDLGSETRIAEWECPLLFRAGDQVAVWKGDVVEVRPGDVAGVGGLPEGGRYRIRSLSISARGRQWRGRRLVTYTGERIDDIGASPEEE